MAESLEHLQIRFVSQDVVYPECDLPIHKRWESIVTALPEVARARLTDDFTELFRRAEREYTGRKLGAAYDLAVLQARFMMVLGANRLVLRHTVELALATSLMWQQRLGDQFEATKPTRRRGSRIRKGMTVEPPRVPAAFH